jgi:Ca-activated chloride channel homolog
MFENFEFAQPQWLWLLLGLFLAIKWLIQPNYKNLYNFADPHLLSHLLLHKAKYSWYMDLAWIAIAAAGIIALAGPRWDYVEQDIAKPQANLLILLDLSDSMHIQDLPHSRLELARQKIESILELQSGIYIGLAVFAAIPHLVTPLSDDYQALNLLLQHLSPDLMPTMGKGKRIDLAIQGVSDWLPGANQHVLLISDGDFKPNELKISLELLHNASFKLHALGIGSEQGAHIELADGSWQRDTKGNVVISRLNENYLRQLASNGIYQRASTQTQDIQLILQQINASQSELVANMPQRLWHERFYLLVLLMLLLLLPYFRV